MARKLAISNAVLFDVQLILRDGAEEKKFRFKLSAERRDSAVLSASLKDENLAARDFLLEIVNGWEGQRLVLEEDGATPSPFSKEAFADMLSAAGAPAVILQSYLRAVTAKEKN